MAQDPDKQYPQTSPFRELPKKQPKKRSKKQPKKQPKKPQQYPQTSPFLELPKKQPKKQQQADDVPSSQAYVGPVGVPSPQAYVGPVGVTPKAADDDGDGWGKAFLGALAHIGAGMAYGAGAGLAGTDPTYLAKQVQARRDQQEARDELISVQDAVKAGNPEEYAAFEEALGGRNFTTLASFNAAWNSYSVGRQGERDEFDAGELIPTYSSVLEAAGQGHVVEGVMQSNASNTARLGVMRELAKPYIDRAVASAERIQAARDQFKGVPIEDIVNTLIENGYRGEELSEMSDDDIYLLAVAASANVTAVDMDRIDPRGQDGRPLHLDKLSQLMPGHSQEEIGRGIHDKNIAIQDKRLNDDLWTAKLEYDRQETEYRTWRDREAAVVEDMGRAMERGDFPPKELLTAYTERMTAVEAEMWPEGRGRPYLFADPAPGSEDPNNSDMGTVRISSLAMLAKGAVGISEALQRVESPEQVTPRALAAMDERSFTTFIKDLPVKQARPLRAKYDLYRRADAGRLAINTVISEVGSDPQIAELFGYGDFVGKGDWADFAGKGLTEISETPDAIKAFADVGDQHLNVEALKALAPALKAIPALGLTNKENLILITALKDHRLTTDEAATNLLVDNISTSWGALLSGGSYAAQGKFMNLITGLTAFGELEGVDLPVPVKAELDNLKVVTDQIKPHANIFAAKSVYDLLAEASTPAPGREADPTVLGALRYTWDNISRTSSSDTTSVISSLGSDDIGDQQRGRRELASVVAADEGLQATRGNRMAFVEAGGIYGGDLKFDMIWLRHRKDYKSEYPDPGLVPTLMWGEVDLFDSEKLYEKLQHGSKDIKSTTGAASIWQEIGRVFSPQAVDDTSDGGMWENAIAAALSPGGSHDLSQFKERAVKIGNPELSYDTLERERAALALEVGETIKHAVMVVLINRNIEAASYWGYKPPQTPGGPAPSDVAREMVDTHRDQAKEFATYLRSPYGAYDPSTPWQIYATTAMGRGVSKTMTFVGEK